MREGDEPDEVMMPVTKPQALQQIEIQVLRQISDTLVAQGKSLTTMTERLHDVRERLIRIESQEMSKKLEQVEREAATAREKIVGDLNKACDRINTLEAAQDRRSGAVGLVEWFAKYTPWLVAILAAGAAGIGLQKGVGG